jgi:hypothetical protein
MKLLLGFSALAAAALGARLVLCDGCCGASPADVEPSGDYVEARTASVFAGACHYNGELTTAGREAVLAWRIDGGRVEGVDLDGVELVAAVAAGDNLSGEVARKSVLYVDSDASPRQRELAAGWVRAKHAAALGEVIAVEEAEVEVELDGERYRARAGEAITLEGSRLAERECCKMPYDVWYRPFAPLDARVVGNSASFAWTETRLAPRFERSGQNDAFVGTFGGPRPGCCAAEEACAPPEPADVDS